MQRGGPERTPGESRPRKRPAAISFEEDEAADAAYEEEKRAREASEMRRRGGAGRPRIRTYGPRSGPDASVIRVRDHTHPEAVEERKKEALAKARAARDAALSEAQAQALRQQQHQQQQQQQQQQQLQQKKAEEEEVQAQAQARAKARVGLQAAEMRLEEAPPQPPSDGVQQQVIDLLARFVATNGAQFEEMALERKAKDEFFKFLVDKDSPEAAYYAWKKEELLKKEEVEEYSRMRAFTGKLGAAGSVRRTQPQRKRPKYFGAVPEKEEEVFRARMRDLSTAGGNAEKIAISAVPETQQSLGEDNIGRRMMEKLGWQEGSGLGAGGAENPSEMQDNDDLFAVYKKKMMAAYRNRPNPYG